MNKLMARIVAVVLAVMMLGTVSFAANDATLNDANDTITPSVDTLDSGIYTVKAYTDVTNTIVAMYQGEKPTTPIKIDSTKIADTDNNVIVEFSGKGGTKSTVTLAVTRIKNEGDAATVSNVIELDGVKYEGVAHITNTFNLAGKIVQKMGYILSSSEYPGETKTVNAPETIISGNGDVTFDVVVLKVPDGVTISADYFVEYK